MSEHPDQQGRPDTGDAEVDAALRRLEEALDGTDDEVATQALARAHRELQARLTDPAPAAPPGTDAG
ncbi:hypothetical protein BJF86_12810 [Serinicoccus sp. CNJ-927]|uniref:hypothetical protein n=1 Tax=Serinicoccus TaxID=265976 RepID=UPI0009591CEE|nr:MULTISPECIES: hypothetical protein [Serinicoccus]OLT44177.1 hypothetical protein BJF86_12810 [Serinicoccus sp. CNJ-927]